MFPSTNSKTSKTSVNDADDYKLLNFLDYDFTKFELVTSIYFSGA